MLSGSAAKSTALPPPCSSSAAPSATTVPAPVAPSALVPRICSAPSWIVSSPVKVLSWPSTTIRPSPRFPMVPAPEIPPAIVKLRVEALVQDWLAATTRSERIAWSPVAPAPTPMPPEKIVSVEPRSATFCEASSRNRRALTVWLPFRSTFVVVRLAAW